MSINRYTNKEALLQACACTQMQWTNSTMRKKEICHLAATWTDPGAFYAYMKLARWRKTNITA